MASDPEENYLAENRHLRKTLDTLSLQQTSNQQAVAESGPHELATSLLKCRELIVAISQISADLESLKQLFTSLPEPKSAECNSQDSSLVEDFQNFVIDVEKTRVALESDFINKINGNIFEIERKLGEYESYIGFASLMTNSNIMHERIARFKEDIFDDLEPAIKELFTTLITAEKEPIEPESPNDTPVGSIDNTSIEEPPPESEGRIRRSSSNGSEDAGKSKVTPTNSGHSLSLPRKKRAKTATAYNYKMKNTDNVTRIQQGHRIGEIARSWNETQVKTKVYYMALHFRLMERVLSKDLIQKAERWYSDHKDISDTRQLIRDYEKIFINEQFFDSLDSHLSKMDVLCSEYEGHKPTFQIESFKHEKMKELYHDYQRKCNQLRLKIEELVPYLKAHTFENVSVEMEEMIAKLGALLVSLLTTINSLRENQQGINVNLNEKLSELQNGMTTGEQLMDKLTNEFECLSQSLIEKKQSHYDQISSDFKNHQTDFNSCKQNLINLWVADTEENFVHKEKFQSRKILIASGMREHSQGEETAFLIKQSATKDSKDDIWAPSLNLTNMNAAMEILGEMFDNEEGEDGNEAEEMLACARDLIDAILTWIEEKRNVLKNNQSKQLELHSLSQEFFRIQTIRGEFENKVEEFESIKSEYASVLNQSHTVDLSENLTTLSDDISSREQRLSVLLVFLQDFDKCVKESIGQLAHIQNAYEAIFSNKTDITQGVIALKDLSADLSAVERGISKLTRKSIGIKKRFPKIVLNPESADLPDRFLSLKREVADQLINGQMGSQQLAQYSDQLIEKRARLDELRRQTQSALNAPLVINGTEIDDTDLKLLERDIEVFRNEFESIPILEDPPCTKLTIPANTLSERDNILCGLTGLQEDISAWEGHVTAVKSELSSMKSKFATDA